MSRYRRSQTPGATYFLAVATYRRQAILCDAPIREALRNGVAAVPAKRPFTIDAWVLLPYYLHAIWTVALWGVTALAISAFFRRSENRRINGVRQDAGISSTVLRVLKNMPANLRFAFLNQIFVQRMADQFLNMFIQRMAQRA